jgi:uncharacterized RDD family membrane protein YckC
MSEAPPPDDAPKLRRSTGVRKRRPRPPERPPAGFWLRFAAFMLDAMLLNVVIMPVLLVAGGASRGAGAQGAIGILLAMAFLVALVFGYFAGFVAWRGATPGKLAFGMRVVLADGRPVDFGRALARHFCWGFSYLLLGLGFVAIAFDERKRALHDRMAGTRVVFDA